MSDLMKLVQDADLAMLEWENAKSEWENAKLQVEMAKSKVDSAKEKFDELLMGADELGIPRSKLKKLVEERSQALLASGLISSPANASSKAPPVAAKAKAPKKQKNKQEDETAQSKSEADLNFEADDRPGLSEDFEESHHEAQA